MTLIFTSSLFITTVNLFWDYRHTFFNVFLFYPVNLSYYFILTVVKFMIPLLILFRLGKFLPLFLTGLLNRLLLVSFPNISLVLNFLLQTPILGFGYYLRIKKKQKKKTVNRRNTLKKTLSE